jgi:hypothetical protein
MRVLPSNGAAAADERLQAELSKFPGTPRLIRFEPDSMPIERRLAITFRILSANGSLVNQEVF